MTELNCNEHATHRYTSRSGEFEGFSPRYGWEPCTTAQNALRAEKMELCHCGRPIHIYTEPGMQGFTRGMCLECDAVRCDLPDSECPYDTYIDKNLVRGEYEELKGRIEEALEYLTRRAEHTFREQSDGQVIETVGCILTGRKSGWWPHKNQPTS